MSVSHAQLKAFHAVAVYGSFTRAAERLFLTQPAVSDQVRKLEERYGVLLFHRNKRSVRLSELGERLLAVTQRLFAIEAEAEELLSASSALRTGTLTLAVDAPVHVLPQIARFCERYPGIAVRVETGNTDESLQRLFSYQADLALLGRDVSDERLLSLTLRNDPIVAFVSLSHPWAGRESIRLADLDDMPLVLREQGSVTRQTLEEEMSRAGLRIRPAIQVEGREASREAVVAGIGVGGGVGRGVRRRHAGPCAAHRRLPATPDRDPGVPARTALAADRRDLPRPGRRGPVGAELGRGFAQAKKSPADAGLRSRAGGHSGLLLFLLQGPVQLAAGALDHHLGDRDFPALGVDDGATAVLLRIEGDHAALGGIGVLRIHCPSPHQVYRQSRERR
nr:LysR substrate-binding domain-containing protein [Pseudomonas aeruginosa]